MKTQLLIGLLILSASFNAFSHGTDSTEIRKIEKVVDDFFKGLESGDSALLSSLFHAEMRLITTSLDGNNENRIDAMSASEFLKAIGASRDGSWEEKVANLRISMDQGLANAWMDYTFYYNGKLSHCGVNSFEIMKERGEWLIVGISDTRRTKNCDQ